jgi:hypothetical protein
MLRDIATSDTSLSRISVAIDWIRRNFATRIKMKAHLPPVRMEALFEPAQVFKDASERMAGRGLSTGRPCLCPDRFEGLEPPRLRAPISAPSRMTAPSFCLRVTASSDMKLVLPEPFRPMMRRIRPSLL